MLRGTPIRTRMTPVRRPQATPAPTQGSPFDILRAIDEVRNLYGALKDGMAKVDKALELFASVKQGPPGVPGAARDGKPGRHGTDVSQEMVDAAVQRYMIQPKDGISPDMGEIISSVVASKKFAGMIKNAMRSAAPTDLPEMPTAEEIATMVLAQIQDALPTKEHVDARIAEVRNHIATKEGGWRGGGDTVVAGTGISIVNTVNGNKQIIATGGGGISFETPAGNVDNSNTVFTVANTPLYIIVNGAQYRVGNGIFTSFMAGTITLSVPVGTGGFIESAFAS